MPQSTKPPSKTQVYLEMANSMSDEVIVTLIAELGDDRAPHVAHLAQLRLRQLRARLVTAEVTPALVGIEP